MDASRTTLRDLWRLLPGDDSSLERLQVSGQPGFHSAFEVDEAVTTSVSAAALAIAELGGARGLPPAGVQIDGAVAAASFTGHVEVDGSQPAKWAELSGYYLAADDRLVQLHCNFPHHARGAVEFLGTTPERAAVEQAIASWDADELEQALIERGMIAAKLRTMAEWVVHPHALATRDLPLISFEQIGEADPVDLGAAQLCPEQALAGIRVLDGSRVLAGPVAGQTLAAHGADVLRIGAPHLPFVESCVLSTGAGKRNAFVDLDTPGGRDAMDALLSRAHVWIDAYRPGAFHERGFSNERAATLNPGIIIVQLSAFDWMGPWAGRRGFDSIVQSTTGLVHAGTQASHAQEPVPLPVQVLDYATGQLAAFAAARALLHQARHGGSWRVRVSLLRTRNWLVDLGGPQPFTPAPAIASRDALFEVDSEFGRLTLTKPPTGAWQTPPTRLGSADAKWLS